MAGARCQPHPSPTTCCISLAPICLTRVSRAYQVEDQQRLDNLAQQINNLLQRAAVSSFRLLSLFHFVPEL